MKTLDMNKLSLYQEGLKLHFSKIESESIKEELKELSYHGEVLERFTERNIENLELLTVIALDVIIESRSTTYENQKAIFYNNVVQSNLLGEYFLFDFVVSLFDNLYGNGKHNLFKLYIKLSEEEKMFFLNYLFMRKRVTDLKAVALRKIAKEFKPFYTHAQITTNKIEKMYLYTLIFNSKSKEYKDVEDFLRGSKVIRIKDEQIEELSIRFGLDKEELSYVYLITQFLFQDYFKEKTFFGLANLMKHLKTYELTKHLGVWIKDYKLRKHMISSTTSHANATTVIHRGNKKELSLYTMFFTKTNSFLSPFYEDELEKVFHDVFEKDSLETLRLLNLEDSYVYLLSFIKNRRPNLYDKISEDINDEKLSVLAYGNLRALEEGNDYDRTLIAKAMMNRIIKKEDFVRVYKSFVDNFSRNNFTKDILRQLSTSENFLENFYHYFGKDNTLTLVKWFVMPSFSNLKLVKSIEVREFLIKESLSYINDYSINRLEEFLFFLYKTTNICSNEMFKDIEEAIVYLHDKKIPGKDTFMYESLNQIFHIEKGKVGEFLRENTPIFNYTTSSMSIDDAKMALKPFLLTTDSSIILELFKVIIEETPFHQRVTDRKRGFYYFINEMQKMKMSNKLKKELKETYMEALINNNTLLKHNNIGEIEEVLNYLKQSKGE